jgi:Transposase
MDVVYPRCCGLDIHKRTVVACRIVSGPDARPQRDVRTFGTMTDELLALADWLDEAGVTHAALEATGVYWQPLWNLLEDRFALLLVNAAHVRQVPGRKTDVKLRHEVVSVAVGPEQSGPNLVFCHQYPTAACDRSNPAVRSPRDNVASPHRGRLPCEGRRRLPASGRSGARVEGPG